METNPKKRLTVAEVSENFSRAADIADREGSVVLSEDGEPRYLLVSLREKSELTHEELVDATARRIFEKYKKAFEELAK